MNKNIIIVIVILIAFGSLVYFTKDKKDSVNNTTTYSSQDLGFEFTYKTGAEGYVLQEAPGTPSSANLVKTITLMQTIDKENLAKNGAPEGGEGPATITINILKNVQKRQPSVWAMENIAYSNYNLMLSQPLETVVGGANAVSYKADGLYASNNVVVAHGGYIYVFTGMYLDENSNLYRDFSPLIDSVKFIPSSTNTNL